MIKAREKQQEYINNNFSPIAEKINQYYKNKQCFILRDLLEEGQNNYYYIYTTKGIILTLLNSKNIEIVGFYNGYKNYVYKCVKEINL